MRAVVTILCFICFAATTGDWARAQTRDIDVTPNSADFEVIEIGAQRERSFAVSNSDTTEALIIFALDIIGQDADQFQLTQGGGGFILQPGEVNLVTVRFSPTSPGIKDAVLRIESNDPDESPLGIPLTGVGRGQPDIALAQLSVNFGNVVVNSTAFQDLVIINEGFDNLEIEQVQVIGDNLDMFALVEEEGPTIIQTGSRDTLRIQFTPSSTGIKRGMVRLLSNDPDESLVEVNLEGQGVRPQIVLDSLSHDYGINTVGEVISHSFFISNIGDAALVIDSLTFRGEAADQFGVGLVVDSLIVTQGASLQLPVTYEPVSSGFHAAILSLFTNDPERSQVDITLRGSAQSPSLVSNIEAISFGALLTNGLQANLGLELSNLGIATLFIDSLSIRGPNANQFSILNEAPSYTIRSGETAALVVVYTPIQDGDHEAELAFFTNDPNVNELVVPLSGSSQSLQIQAAEQAEFGKDFIVSVILPEGLDGDRGQLVYRSADSFEFIIAGLSGSGAETQGLVPGQAVGISGIEYYVQIGGSGNDEGQVTLPSAEPEQRPFYAPTSIDQFDAPLSMNAWMHQMITVPVDLDDKDIESVLVDDYGPYNTRRWRLFRWEGEGYVEYPDIDGEFERGAGFWLITNDGASFDIKNGISINPTIPFELVLQPGWNQIGSPYPYPISWLSESIDPRIEPPVGFDGLEFQYDQAFLLPWEGYFVRNLANEPLTVPLLRRAVSGSKTTARSNDDVLYRLQLVAEVDGEPLRDSHSFIGFASTASDGRDRLDLSEAPPIGDYVRMSIMQEGERYASNFKPMSEEGQFWDVELDASVSNSAINVQLNSMGELPGNYELFVLDRDKRKMLDIADSTFSIDVGRSGTSRKLRVLLGSTQFAEQHREGIPLVPLEYNLEQNFPNPFSGGTTIRYEISEESPVQLEVFNLMGQRVLLLVDAVQDAGSYELQWDGNNENGLPFASGIYLYRIRAGDFTDVRKMLLVR